MSQFLDAAIDCHRRRDIAGARRAALAGIAERPRDVALLHFLGMMELQAGDPGQARAALEKAVALDPRGAALVSLARLFARYGDWPALARLGAEAPVGAAGNEYLSLRARALQEVGDMRGSAEALIALAERRPEDAAVAVAAARALSDAGHLERAETAYRRLLATWPAEQAGLLGVTGLLESLGRSGELAPLFAAARDAGASEAIVALGDAIAHRERGEFARALDAIDQAEAILPSGTWQQMRGELADRAGDIRTALKAFTAMNQADAAEQPEAAAGVRRFRDSLATAHAQLDEPLRVAGPDDRPPPVFLLGFPRSGTTLLDTFLMGHPGVAVHEERPFLERAAASPGASAEDMRAAYWQALDRESDRRDALQVDKYPLASARGLLIHRLFPDASILFALRHPCDVVLSCFMTRFRLNWGVASFLTIEDSAQTYARVMELWTETRERLALEVLEVRYEALIADPAAVIADVTRFVGLAPHESMLDHQATARARGLITTPSFAQVIGPLSTRAVGRWKRYRERLDPVLPLLAPWCERFGYSLDE